MNVDRREVEKFGGWAHGWWDLEGEFKSLHRINPLRLRFIDGIAPLEGKRVLDIGCGGGILAESMAALGAEVTGIDLAEEGLEAARSHLQVSGLQVTYRALSAEAIAEVAPGAFDVVTCMEMIEHVPDPGSIIRSCGRLVKPGGHVFVSTLNRSVRSYLFAIVVGEYVLKLLPAGTHEYRKLVRHGELEAYCRDASLRVDQMTGIVYNPFTRQFSLGRDTGVNYLVHALSAAVETRGALR